MSQHDPVRIYTSGLVPPSTEGAAIIIGDCVVLVLAMVWTVLRMISRRKTTTAVLIEDYMHIFALVCFCGSIGISIAMVCAGMGRHINEIGSDHIVAILKYSFASQVLYALSLGLVKVSICWALARIFSTSRSLILGARVLMSLSAAWAIMTILIGMLICRPVRKNWYTTVAGHCGNQNAGFASVTIVNLVIDLFILALPIRSLLGLHLPMPNRLGLLAIFSMGIVTMIFAAIRLAAVLDLNFADFPHSVRMSHIWTISENAVALIVSSSIYLRPMFDWAFRAALSFGSRSRCRSGHSNGSRKNMLEREGRPSTSRARYATLSGANGAAIELGSVERACAHGGPDECRCGYQHQHQQDVEIENKGEGVSDLRLDLEGIHVEGEFWTTEQRV